MATAPIEQTKFTPPQLAKKWGVSPDKILYFIRTGELRAINLAHSKSHRPRYRIDAADIEAFERLKEVVPDGGLSTTQKLRRRRKNPEIKEFF